jgi:hypothetical protein
MVKATLLCLVSLVALAFPVRVFAQLTNHPYDIKRYELEIRPDFSVGTLCVGAKIDIDNPRGDHAFRFGLSRQYERVTVTVDGREVALTRSGGVVEIAAPERKNATLRFTMCGGSMRSEDEERPLIDENSLFLLWSDRFYPIDFGDWAPVKTSVLLPAGMLAIAPGVLKSTRTTAEGVWHVFEARTPTVNFSVFADRRWIRTTRSIGQIRMVTLLHPESQRFADILFRTSEDVVEYYTRLHGYYPAEQFAFVTLAGMYARRAFPGFVGYEPKYLERTMARDGYDGHETSLLWWGYATHGEGPGAFQWTEGFGDYVEMLYAEARQKPMPFNRQRAREAFLAIDPKPEVALTDLKGNTPQPLIHGRLPWMMEALRGSIGDSAFRRGIRLLFHRYRSRTFTLDQFMSVFEEVVSPDLRSLVRPAFRG